MPNSEICKTADMKSLESLASCCCIASVVSSEASFLDRFRERLN